jgi:hypothetical protein
VWQRMHVYHPSSFIEINNNAGKEERINDEAYIYYILNNNTGRTTIYSIFNIDSEIYYRTYIYIYINKGDKTQ